jgi:hypothetical protein
VPVETKPIFRPDVIRLPLLVFTLPEQVARRREKVKKWAEIISSGSVDAHKEQEILGDFINDVFCELLDYVKAVDNPKRYSIKREKHVRPTANSPTRLWVSSVVLESRVPVGVRTCRNGAGNWNCDQRSASPAASGFGRSSSTDSHFRVFCSTMGRPRRRGLWSIAPAMTETGVWLPAH